MLFRRILNTFKSDKKKSKEIEFVKIENPSIEFIPAELINGIYDIENGYFWNHHGCTKEDYIQLAEKSKILYEKYLGGKDIDLLKEDVDCKDIVGAYLSGKQIICVYKRKDGYQLVSDGRHRVAAAKELKIFIPAKVVGEYK